MKQVALLVLLVVAVNKATSNPTDGDVRLEAGSNARSGRVEIYYNRAWGSVCYDYTHPTGGKGAARAVCRQLGYNDYISVGNVTEMGVTPGTDLIVLGNVSCSVDSALNDATQHILRCSHDLNPPSCSHGDDMAVVCDSRSKYDSPYDSEVRLVGGDSFLSNGILEVYLHDEWGTVCSSQVDSDVADTVCRQMGYTDAFGHSSTPESNNPADRVWLTDITCTGPQSCLSLCFSYPSSSQDVDCPSERLSVINCTYVPSNALPAGSGSLCTGFIALVSHILAIVIGVIVVGFILLILGVLIPVCICCCVPGCLLFGLRERRVVYETIS